MAVHFDIVSSWGDLTKGSIVYNTGNLKHGISNDVCFLFYFLI